MAARCGRCGKPKKTPAGGGETPGFAAALFSQKTMYNAGMDDKLRYSFAAGAALCWGSLAIAYFYMERHLGLAPCPLCILDRIVVAAMGCVFLAQFFLAGRGWRLAFWGANAVFLAAGFVFAVRHIIKQRTPPDLSAGCLGESFAAETLDELVRKAFTAGGDCGAIYWQFAGLSIPEQVLVLFVAFAALLALQAFWLFRRGG